MKFLELTNDGPILVFKSGDTGSYSYGNPYDLDTMTSSFKIKVISSPRRFGFRQSPGSIVNLPSIETVAVFWKYRYFRQAKISVALIFGVKKSRKTTRDRLLKDWLALTVG